MTDINENQKLVLVQREHSFNEYKKNINKNNIEEKASIENEFKDESKYESKYESKNDSKEELKIESKNDSKNDSKENLKLEPKYESQIESKNDSKIELKKEVLTLDNRHINNEIEEIINKDPLEELKLIKEKIKKENSKIKEINTKLDQLNTISKPIKRRNLQLNDNIDSYFNSKKRQNNNLLSPKMIFSSSGLVGRHNSLYSDSSLNAIHEKMKNLRKIKIEKININKELDLDEPTDFSEKRNKSISKMGNLIEKSNLRILALEEEEQKARQEQQKKMEKKMKLFRERELEREKQRKKIINKINNISLSQANKYSPKKNYVTSEEKEEIRKMKEEALLKIEKEKRKLKYLPISSEELNKFSNEVKKNEKILKLELEKKKKQMEELWKERKNLLPKYHSKFMDLNIELDNESKEELKLKQEKLKYKELERVNFGKEKIKNFQPKTINANLKSEREQRIKELKGINKFNNIKELGNKIKLKTNKIVLSQPKNFNKKNVFVIEKTTAEKQAKKLTGKPVDYLLECRKEKSKIEFDKLIQSNSAKKVKKWKEMLDSGGNNVYDNVEKIKIQAAIMDDKANNLNQILKNGGNNSFKVDELSQEASNLYMNSIQAKLQILNKVLSTDN